MTSQHRTRAGLAAALAVASLAAPTAAGADPNPAQRVQSSQRGAALAQEQYYMSHKPAVPAAGHEFGSIDAPKTVTRYDGRELRTIEVSDSAGAVAAPDTRVDAPAPPEPLSSSGFEWGDAAIGAGSAIGLVLLLAGGVAVVSRRQRPATS
jgi:hypothetical protein